MLVVATMVTSASLGSLALAGIVGPSSTAGASAPPSVTRIAPITGPAGTSIPLSIHGHGFDTTVGATTVSFSGTPAVSVDCASPSLCKVVTPNLVAGTVSVTVTTDGTPLNSETFTVTSYSAPLVRIVLNAKRNAVFSVHQLVDSYPAPGGLGNDAVVIENRTAVSRTVTNSSVGSMTTAPGDSYSFTLLADDGPYVFFTTGSPTSALTVKARNPA
jgi:hypothetical protein